MNIQRKLNLSIGLAAVLSVWATTGAQSATAVEIFFSAESKVVSVGDSGAGTDTSFDIFFHTVAGEPSVPASAFGAKMTITPQPGAAGSVVFNPDPIMGGDNNILPATTNPFLGFDILFANLGPGGTGPDVVVVSGVFSEPGNVTLPDGVGLAAIPIHVAPGSRGDFLVEFDTDPQFAGVGFLNGPDEELYPVGTHVSGTVTIIPEPTTLTLAALGLIGCAVRRRRRQR